MITDTNSTFHAIKKKSVIGVITLTSRTAVLQIIASAGTFFLTVFLTPEIFGVFFVVSAIVSFLNYFSDVGLGAALIQKKEEVTNDDLSSTFTIQQLVVGIVVIVAFLASGTISQFYHLSIEGAWLFRALVVSFFISSLKTIPSIILERKLDFNKLIIPQIIEVTAFYAIAVYCASTGLGVRSFTYAVIARSILGLIAIYLLVPWRPYFHLDKHAAKKLLSFGIPFQMNSFLAVMKDDLFTLFLGKVLPFSAVGYIGWAKKWSEAPLRLIMDSIIKVTFPTYSRLQQYPDKLSKAVNKSLFFLTFFIAPMSIGMILFIQPLVSLIPTYTKWEPAIFSFFLFVISSGIASISTPLINALNAIGKISITLRFMVLWTVLTWVITPLFIYFFQFNGVAIASVIIGATVILVIRVCKQYVQFDLWENSYPILIPSGIMAGAIILIQRVLPISAIALGVEILAGMIVYLGSFLLFFRKKLLSETSEIMSIIKS